MEKLLHRAQLSEVRQWARSLDGGYLLLSEVAEQLDISERALKKLIRRRPELAPGAVGRRGKVLLYLYTPDEVTGIRPYLPAPSRMRVWTSVEYDDRMRRERQVRYWRARARTLADRGDATGARTAADRDRTLTAGLRAQRAKRMKERAAATRRK